VRVLIFSSTRLLLQTK